MVADKALRDSIDIISAHGFSSTQPKCLPAPAELQALAVQWNKPIVIDAKDVKSVHAERAGHNLAVQTSRDSILIDAAPAKAPIIVVWR
jgi:hypothetical protein